MKYKLIVVIILLAFVSGCVQSPVGVSSLNGSNFSLNLTAHPILTSVATIDCGINMTCDQVGTTISLNSLGVGGGDTNNYYNYTNYTNGTTLNSSLCAANEVLHNYDNGTGWECIINDHTGFLTSETDPIAMGNISLNMVAWLNTSNLTYSAHIINTSMHTDSDNISQFLNDAGFVTNATMASDNTKYNVTGGNISGNVSILGSHFYSNRILAFYNPNGTLNTVADNQDSFDTIFGNNYLTGSNNLNFALFQSVGNTTGHLNVFQGRRARGTTYPNGTATIYPLNTSDAMFRITGAGWDGSAWSGTVTKIEMIATNEFNDTYRPTKIVFGVTADTERLNTVDSVVIQNHNLTVYGLQGSGNAYVCVDSTGKQYRGSPTC